MNDADYLTREFMSEIDRGMYRLYQYASGAMPENYPHKPTFNSRTQEFDFSFSNVSYSARFCSERGKISFMVRARSEGRSPECLDVLKGRIEAEMSDGLLSCVESVDICSDGQECKVKVKFQELPASKSGEVSPNFFAVLKRSVFGSLFEFFGNSR